MNMETILGGSPLGVFIRLVILSLVVGIILKALELHPFEFFVKVQEIVVSVYNIGFQYFGNVFHVFIWGAAVVIPIWLIMRVLATLFGKKGAKS